MAAAYLAVGRGCGKIPYLTEIQAGVAARKMYEVPIPHPKQSMTVNTYVCLECRAWHWGHTFYARPH